MLIQCPAYDRKTSLGSSPETILASLIPTGRNWLKLASAAKISQWDYRSPHTSGGVR